MRHYNGRDQHGRHSWFLRYEGSWMECYDYSKGYSHGFSTGLGFVEDVDLAVKIGRAFTDAQIESFKNYQLMLEEMIK